MRLDWRLPVLPPAGYDGAGGGRKRAHGGPRLMRGMNPGLIPLIPALLAIAAPLAAQEFYYPHHNLTFGAGIARPRGDLGGALDDSPNISLGYGYRFIRYLQADIGLDMTFGAAGVRGFLPTDFGYSRVSDREYFLPFGGRAIAPLLDGRLLISGGAGGAWMKYHERVQQPSQNFHIDCFDCTTRSGWGYYALANASYFLDASKHFRVGVTARMIRGRTDGGPVGLLPPFETKDRWLHLGAEVGFSF